MIFFVCSPHSASSKENRSRIRFIDRVTFRWPAAITAFWLVFFAVTSNVHAQQAQPPKETVPPPSQASSTTPLTKGPASKGLGDRYLMLVNTAIAFRLQDQEIAQFDKSPYDGIAVAFSYNYDVGPPPTPANIDAKIAHWKTITSKDIWPWVFVNRIIGVDDGEENPYTKDNAYFHHIKGADLEDKAGALTDFLVNWQNALQAAKDSHVPGIVCDIEFYNYHKEYNIAELARQSGKKPQELIPLLRSIGARMADIAGATYPDATLWFLFTGFSYAGHFTVENEHYYGVPTYIVMGMLDEIQSKRFPLKVISGGEAGLAYCHESPDKFRDKIAAREAAFSPQIKKYAGILETGGTMTLFSDRSAMQGWVKQDCGSSQASNVEDLQPYLELMLKTFRYNWIYSSGDGGYNAFQPATASRFDAVIRKAASKVIAPKAH
jgi:hypothetical protein